jgi:hypothetical protein
MTALVSDGDPPTAHGRCGVCWHRCWPRSLDTAAWPFGAVTTAAGMAIGTGMAAMGLAWRSELARRWQLGFGAMWRLYRPSAVPKTATAGLQAFPA